MAATASTTVAGGMSAPKDPSDDVNAIITDLKPDIETNTGKEYSTFEIVKFKSQVVAGINYLVKIKVGDGDYLHVKVYKPLPHTGEHPKLTSVTEGKSLDDDLA